MPAKCASTFPKRCSTPDASSRSWSSSNFPRRMLPSMRPRAGCSIRFQWPSTRRSRLAPYLAVIDRDHAGKPYRFLDMGALIATQAFGENEPAVVSAVLESLPFVTSRYAHSEYQTVLSLRLKAALSRGRACRRSTLFRVQHRRRSGRERDQGGVAQPREDSGDTPDGGFVVSFEGAFHGRTLGSLAVTHRKKARLGFPTFDWPHISFPVEEPGSPKETARREERSLKQLWDLLVSGRLPRADKSKDTSPPRNGGARRFPGSP